MTKINQLFILKRFVSLTMVFLIGFWGGTYYPKSPALILGLLLGICALGKVELYHWTNKLQKSLEQQKTPERSKNQV